MFVSRVYLFLLAALISVARSAQPEDLSDIVLEIGQYVAEHLNPSVPGYGIIESIISKIESDVGVHPKTTSTSSSIKSSTTAHVSTTSPTTKSSASSSSSSVSVKPSPTSSIMSSSSSPFKSSTTSTVRSSSSSTSGTATSTSASTKQSSSSTTNALSTSTSVTSSISSSSMLSGMSSSSTPSMIFTSSSTQSSASSIAPSMSTSTSQSTTMSSMSPSSSSTLSTAASSVIVSSETASSTIPSSTSSLTTSASALSTVTSQSATSTALSSATMATSTSSVATMTTSPSSVAASSSMESSTSSVFLSLSSSTSTPSSSSSTSSFSSSTMPSATTFPSTTLASSSFTSTIDSVSSSQPASSASTLLSSDTSIATTASSSALSSTSVTTSSSVSSVSSTSSTDLTSTSMSSAISSSMTTSIIKSSSTSSTASATSTPFVNQTTCNGQTYTYQQLAGYGFTASNLTDQYGDTIGGMGSGLAFDRTAWTKLANGSYTGVLYTLPDRGWNTQGTYNYQPRIHKFNILFTPNPAATVTNPSGVNLFFYYSNSILLTGPDGTPTTGLDADGSGHFTYAGFPDLPITTYSGNGFGSTGPTQQRIPLDTEGLVLNNDGTFWISDEYGPYVYLFSSSGMMLQAIRPNDAIIPMRNGSESFSADSQFGYINGGAGDDVSPADNPTGRDNNHGFEGIAISGDGTSLYFLLQAAANQEGGLNKQTERYSRFVKYDITNPSAPVYSAEWVVPLPFYTDPTAKASKNPKVAAQSEIFHISGNQFFILSRDTNAGHGQASSLSVYRHVDVFDVTGATNIAGSTYDCANCSIASTAGVLKTGITPATYCSFLDYNVNSQLNRFGVHNGGAQDQYLLNEKWESIGLVPVDGATGADGQFYLLSISDNDFITQHGFLNFGQFPYADSSGYNLDSQALMFQVTLPLGVNPFAGQ